MTFRL